MGMRRTCGAGGQGAAAALALALLAGCAAQPQGAGTGGGVFAGGPLASLGNPFSGFGRGGSAAAAAPGTGGAVRDPFAGQGVAARSIPPASGAVAAPAPGAVPAPSSAGTAPAPAPAQPAAGASHTVAAGETAWSIARRYGLSVQQLASANGLSESMTVRIGQRLAIPAAGAAAAGERVTAPGAGSPTPLPPSAAKPLPDEATTPRTVPVAKPEVPDLGASRTAASGSGRFVMPVQGSIVRAYAKGRNDGIDISAPAGTPVKAAGAGTVAAITRDTDGVPIVVVRHDGTLMTVYAGLDALKVAKGDTVTAGQTLGTATSSGVLHFEVRQGFDSVDPEAYLG